MTRPSGRGRLDPMPWSLQILDFVVDDGRDWDLMTWPGCLLEHGWDAGIKYVGHLGLHDDLGNF